MRRFVFEDERTLPGRREDRPAAGSAGGEDSVAAADSDVDLWRGTVRGTNCGRTDRADEHGEHVDVQRWTT